MDFKNTPQDIGLKSCSRFGVGSVLKESCFQKRQNKLYPFHFCSTGNMIGLHSDLRKTLSGEQIESMDSFDLESIINDVS